MAREKAPELIRTYGISTLTIAEMPILVGGNQDSNALAQGINGLYNATVIGRRGPWESLDAVEYVPLEWITWFSNKRLRGPIDNIRPAEAEANRLVVLKEAPIAA